MRVQQELMKEIQGLPEEAQEKVLRLIHFIKRESMVSPRKKAGSNKYNALTAVDEIAIETGIPDLATHHDHYLYGVPKK